MHPVFAALLIATSTQVAPSVGLGLLPDTVLSPSDGPRVVLFATGGAPVAALRLSIPLFEGPAEAGAGQLLVDLALEKIRGLARPAGARVFGDRTPWGLAYTVEGSRADIEYLLYLLRQAAAEPNPPDVERARQVRLADTDRRTESPTDRLLAELRSKVAPGSPHPGGTPESVGGLDAAGVRAVWRRSHQASRMTLTASAGVAPEVLLAGLRAIGSPESDAAGASQSPAPPPARLRPPPPLRVFFGEAWVGGPPGDVYAPIVAALVAQSLRGDSQEYETNVRLWDLPDRVVIVVTGAGRGRAATPMRRRVSAALQSVRGSLDPASAATARGQARWDVLAGAQTARGLVDRVGRASEAETDPGAYQRYLAALEAVTPESLLAYIDGLLGAGPVRGEITP